MRMHFTAPARVGRENLLFELLSSPPLRLNCTWLCNPVTRAVT